MAVGVTRIDHCQFVGVFPYARKVVRNQQAALPAWTKRANRTQVTIEVLGAEGRTNASSHRPWEEYYDEALLALVKERDALIFDRFDY